MLLETKPSGEFPTLGPERSVPHEQAWFSRPAGSGGNRCARRVSAFRW